jgi:hypothetical protein
LLHYFRHPLTSHFWSLSMLHLKLCKNTADLQVLLTLSTQLSSPHSIKSGHEKTSKKNICWHSSEKSDKFLLSLSRLTFLIHLFQHFKSN